MIVWLVIGVIEEVVLWVIMWRLWKEWRKWKEPKEKRVEIVEEEMKEVIRKERMKDGYKVRKWERRDNKCK